jgi:hypothetical protein
VVIRCVWGHDVEAPRLELARPMPPRALGLVRGGCRRWREYFDERHEVLPQLLRFYRGRWPRRGAPLLDFHRWKRSESAELHARLGQLLLVHVDVVTGFVGQRDAAGELRPFRYGELAERLECSIGQLKRALRAFRAAGFIYRHQGRDYRPDQAQPYVGRVATLKVTRAFWAASGVLALRDRWVAKLQRLAERAAAEKSDRDRYREQAARDRIRVQLLELAEAAGRRLSWFETEQAIDAELARRRPPPTHRPAGEPTPAGELPE